MNMFEQNSVQSYQKMNIESARKEKLVSMLLEGAIRFILLARNRDTDVWAYRLNILKAESMILELVGSLNHDKGGEIATSLHRLYIYIVDKLSVALEEKRPEILEEILTLLVPLKDTWNEAMRRHFEETVQATAMTAAVGVAGRKQAACNFRA
ncbi:MAG: flagellar export chaperone FliS [Vulcanimicrobiota bacterium]